MTLEEAHIFLNKMHWQENIVNNCLRYGILKKQYNLGVFIGLIRDILMFLNFKCNNYAIYDVYSAVDSLFDLT